MYEQIHFVCLWLFAVVQVPELQTAGVQMHQHIHFVCLWLCAMVQVAELQSARYVHKTKGQNIKNRRVLEIEDFTQWGETAFWLEPNAKDAEVLSVWTDNATVDEWAWKLLGSKINILNTE